MCPRPPHLWKRKLPLAHGVDLFERMALSVVPPRELFRARHLGFHDRDRLAFHELVNLLDERTQQVGRQKRDQASLKHFFVDTLTTNHARSRRTTN